MPARRRETNLDRRPKPLFSCAKNCGNGGLLLPRAIHKRRKGVRGDAKCNTDSTCPSGRSPKAWPQVVAVQDNSDESLIERIAAGDELAMRTLYARHSVKTFRFVLRLVGDTGKAEDIVSEVFFDVLAAGRPFRGPQPGRHLDPGDRALQGADRAPRPPRRAARPGMAETIADEADDPETCLQKKDEGALLRACIAQLSADHRAVIDLVYYHGKSVEESSRRSSACRATP